VGAVKKSQSPKSKDFIMKIFCKKCDKENKSEKFYCFNCKCKLHNPKWTTNLFMISDIGKRTDMEFSETTIDESVEKMLKSRGA